MLKLVLLLLLKLIDCKWNKIMKTNIPEKLYVDINDNLSDSILYGFTKKRTDDDIEYTRTDYTKKRFIVGAKMFLSEIHRVCDITDENGYRIELRDLQARFEKYINEKLL